MELSDRQVACHPSLTSARIHDRLVTSTCTNDLTRSGSQSPKQEPTGTASTLHSNSLGSIALHGAIERDEPSQAHCAVGRCGAADQSARLAGSQGHPTQRTSKLQHAHQLAHLHIHPVAPRLDTLTPRQDLHNSRTPHYRRLLSDLPTLSSHTHGT